jgi:hypothetical protein
MGRGRAKAKQTKVARELKYSTPSTDLDALQRELAGSKPSPSDDGHDRNRGTESYDEYDYEDDYRR